MRTIMLKVMNRNPLKVMMIFFQMNPWLDDVIFAIKYIVMKSVLKLTRYAHMTEEDKIPCPLCNYRANRSWALRVHMGLTHGQDKVEEYFKPVHRSQKTHPCSLCSRSYAGKGSLRKHIRRKHSNKSAPHKEESSKKSKLPKPKAKEGFLCTYCGQSFSYKAGLESHNQTHTDKRSFSCEICNKTFKRLKDLHLHRVIYSDEKPHQCSQCGKAFKSVDKLKIHMKNVKK